MSGERVNGERLTVSGERTKKAQDLRENRILCLVLNERIGENIHPSALMNGNGK